MFDRHQTAVQCWGRPMRLGQPALDWPLPQWLPASNCSPCVPVAGLGAGVAGAAAAGRALPRTGRDKVLEGRGGLLHGFGLFGSSMTLMWCDRDRDYGELLVSGPPGGVLYRQTPRLG